MRSIYVILFLLFSTQIDVRAQACCSAGTPLLSTMETSATPAGAMTASLTYEYNQLQDVVYGSDEIEGLRQRLSQSMLLELSYGLNMRWSFAALFSFNRQTRQLNSPTSSDSRNKLSTGGLGDAMILAKYNLIPLTLPRQLQLTVGGGVKAPTGRSDLKENGFLLPADMQPGTGSWDALVWLYGYKGFLPAVQAQLFGSASYRINGPNDRYQSINLDTEGYRFGNVLNVQLGGAYRTLSYFDFTLRARYIHRKRDQLSGTGVNNTGGQWFYIVPGLNINIKNISLHLNGRLPLYRDLNGIQLTTSYAFKTAVFYQFNL